MAKILILANNDIGLFKFRKELIEELIKNNEVYISLPFGEFVPALIEIGCKFINTEVDRRGTNPLNDLKLLLFYRKIILKLKPDVVLSYTIKPNVYGGMICRYMKIRYIVNITGLGTAVESEGILSKITLFLYKIALKKASCVFFQNKENADIFSMKNIIKTKYKILPGSGVNLNYYRILDYPDDTTINFLFIGRIMKEKGIEEYLDAAEYITKKYSNTVFHVIGFCEGKYEDKLKQMQEKKIIIYHGQQKDVMQFYKITHCTIHPTYYPEGMSNVLLESSACGRPIITTDRSGCREVIDDGINGFICKQKDSLDLIKKIEMFLALPHELKKQMGLAGRAKVEKEFDRKIIIDNYVHEIMTTTKE